MESKEDAILRITEAMVRKGGYSGFSFRDIAKEVGIKSSSVHYHFPTKEDLGVAVAKYYTERLFDALGEPEALLSVKIHPLEKYISIFRHALVTDRAMCLCGLLGAEIDGLPDAVAAETKHFFQRNLTWLESAYRALGQADSARNKAEQAFALLEGAMIVSKVMQDVSMFERTAQTLLNDI